MIENLTGDFLTPSHAKLTLIASIANYLVWIVLIVQLFNLRATYLLFQSAHTMAGVGFDFMQIIRYDPADAVTIFIRLFSVFLQGVVYILVLKGISLGLNMIVETSLNNKEKTQGAKQ